MLSHIHLFSAFLIIISTLSPSFIISSITMEFSELPEHIFILILSFLSLMDAIRLCSCSRQWPNLWTHCRIIELDRSKFSNQSKAYCWSIGVRRYTAAYVRRLLPRFVEPELDCIKLRLPFEVNTSKDKSFIEKLLGFAAAKRIKEIHLDFSDQQILHLFHRFRRSTVESFPSVFNLTDSIYKVTSLRVSSLGYCGLRNFYFDQKFLELTSLSFAGMFVTREIVVNIGFNCPNLEELSIVDCDLAKDSLQFYYSAWLRLKRLIIRGARPYLARLELFAPRIQYLEISTFIWSIQLGNLKNLVEVVLDFENHYHAINLIELFWGLIWAKSLTLTHRLLEVLPCNDIELHELPLRPENLDHSSDCKFCELPFHLENLEHLRVRTHLEGPALSGALFLLRSSPNLKSISINTEYGIDVDAQLIQYPPYHRILRTTYIPPRFQLISSLKEAKIEGFIGNNDQMNLLEFLLRNAAGLQKVFIFFPNVIPLPSHEIANLIHGQ